MSDRLLTHMLRTFDLIHWSLAMLPCPLSSLCHDSADDGEILPPMPVIDPSELIGHTFLMDKQDGQGHCAWILNVINEEEICKCIGKHERELFLRGLRIVTFLSELNGLDLWATDIGNAYLEAFTMERNYIIAGPEFGQLEGHYLIIIKALYGLCTSGLCWHERFADCLRNEGFWSCKAELDIWMRLNGNLYEYVAMYVVNLCLGMLDLKSFTDTLQKKYNFKLKGTGPTGGSEIP